MMINENKKFVFTILIIILLTNIPAIIMLIPDFKNSIGWIMGSVASAVNFWFLAHKTTALNPEAGRKSVAAIMSKAFILRYAFLIVWSLFVMLYVRPNILAYCLGLFSAQFSLVIYHIYILLTTGTLGKYFISEEESSEKVEDRGYDEEKEEN